MPITHSPSELVLVFDISIIACSITLYSSMNSPQVGLSLRRVNLRAVLGQYRYPAMMWPDKYCPSPKVRSFHPFQQAHSACGDLQSLFRIIFIMFQAQYNCNTVKTTRESVPTIGISRADGSKRGAQLAPALMRTKKSTNTNLR